MKLRVAKEIIRDGIRWPNLTEVQIEAMKEAHKALCQIEVIKGYSENVAHDNPEETTAREVLDIINRKAWME